MRGRNLRTRPHQMILLSGENEDSQQQPAQKSDGADAGRKQKHRCNHGQIKRSGAAAMRAAAPRIQDAGHSHPDERKSPNGCSNRNGGQQTGNDRGLWTPPSEQARRRARRQSSVLASVLVLTALYRRSKMPRCSRPTARPESAGTAPSHRSRTRNNRPALASALCRNRCTRKRTDRHRSAWSPFSRSRNADK
jgi:hypothetical protein